LRQLVSRAQAPVVIARHVGAALPLRQVLAPVTGAPFSRMGAMVAMLYSNATSAALTTLYVKESAPFSLRGLSRRRSVPDDSEPIAHELRALPEQLGVTVDTRMTTGSKPENAILATVGRGGFDLIIMGVLFRPTERPLYFGPKVESILSDARCAIALVVFPERLRA
jgi:nucleotide-binding universal stress UspA family protein